jgi:hypothetical protein
MASITIPPVVTIISWLYQIILPNNERKMFLRLFSWTLAVFAYIYYITMFVICILLSAAEKIPPPVGADILVLAVVLGATTIPQKLSI